MARSRRKEKLAYVVERGIEPGVYFSWEEAERQVFKVSGSRLKGFYSIHEAVNYWTGIGGAETTDPVTGVPLFRTWRTSSGVRTRSWSSEYQQSPAKRARTTTAGLPPQATGAGSPHSDLQVESPAVKIEREHEAKDSTESRSIKEEDYISVHVEEVSEPQDGESSDGHAAYVQCKDEKPSESQDYMLATPSSDNLDDWSEALPLADVPEYDNGSFEGSAVSNSFTALEEEPILSEQQQALVDLVCTGVNVFYTGSAGTGKSTVLKAIVKRLAHKNVNIITPTGISALNVGGQTYFTYAGWRPDSSKLPLERLQDNAAYGNIAHARLVQTDVLIIDEISMIENSQFGRLNKVMQAARATKNPELTDQAIGFWDSDIWDTGLPFGGVQLIVTGDFCQLPPVKPFQYCWKCGQCLDHNVSRHLISEYKCTKCNEVFQEEDKWASCSPAWKQCAFQSRLLTKPFRQKDNGFLDILGKCRLGERLGSRERQLLLKRNSLSKEAVRLFPLKGQVLDFNNLRYEELRLTEDDERTYTCVDRWDMHEDDYAYSDYFTVEDGEEDDGVIRALRNHQYERTVRLSPGAVVVLLHNLDPTSQLVNGSIGKVLGFQKIEYRSTHGFKGRESFRMLESYKDFMEDPSHQAWPVVRFNNGVTRIIKADAKDKAVGNHSWACRDANSASESLGFDNPQISRFDP